MEKFKIEKDSLIDHLTGGVLTGQVPFTCIIETDGVICGGSGFVVWPVGVLCKKHDKQLMEMMRAKAK